MQKSLRCKDSRLGFGIPILFGIRLIILNFGITRPLSIAGKRAGMAGERSGLFSEAVRIIREMRYATFGAYPKYAIWGERAGGPLVQIKEKISMPSCKASAGSSTPPLLFLDLRTHGGTIKWPRAGAILADNYSLAWRTMDAQHWGVPQRRLRISLVLDLTGGRAGEILFEPESLRGHLRRASRRGQAAPRTAENGSGTAVRTDAIPINLQIATRHKSLGERTGLGIGQAGDAAYTLQEGHEHGICCLEDAKAYTLKIRSGCEGGGNGVVYADGYLNYIDSVCYAATTEPNMVICDDCSPAIRSRDYKDPNIVCYDARGNGDGMLSPYHNRRPQQPNYGLYFCRN